MPKRARMIAKSQLRRGSRRLTTRHKVFISFHEADLECKERFVRLMEGRIIDMSVDTGDIDDTGKKTADVRRIIRDEYIRDATVTVVLIGRKTWQRKHVDWEIGSSIRATSRNKRTGLVGIVLPGHPNHGNKRINPRLIPPRLADNCYGDDPFAKIYDWPTHFAPAQIHKAIADAFDRRKGTPPNNGRTQFKRNRTTSWRKGWQ